MGMTSSPANRLSDLNMHWQNHIIIFSKGFYIACDESEKEGSPWALPNSQLIAQLESFGDFYTKKLNLIIKFSDCSLIDLCSICISTFPLTLSSSLGVFHPAFWLCFFIDMERHHNKWTNLLIFLFFCPRDRWNI